MTQGNRCGEWVGCGDFLPFYLQVIRGIGRGDTMGASAPPQVSQGLLYLRGRVKMTQNAGKVDKFQQIDFSKFPREIYPWIPPGPSCFQHLQPPKQNPIYGPGHVHVLLFVGCDYPEKKLY